MTSLQCHQWQCDAAFVNPSEDPEASHLNPAPGTRHYALLNSNEAPLDSDVGFVKLAISKADARLAYLDGEIARVRELREESGHLEEERVSLSSYRIQSHTILSPLRRMPPEVLGEVFSWTLPPRRVSRTTGIQITHSPWVLTHVNSRWRAIAISTPSLWSLVAIVYHDELDPLLAYPLSMVETQIARARAQKLKIYFYGWETSNPKPQIEVFECLAKHASQWEEVSVEVTSALFPLLENLRGRLPSLLRFGIDWHSSESNAGVESIDIFEMAPTLANVDVSNEQRFIPIHLPVQQLTRFSLNAPWEIYRGILKLASNLVEARIIVEFDEDEPWPDQGEIIQSPCLQRLFVSHSQILAYLIFPVLLEMAIQMHDNDVKREVLGHLDASLTRSACPLRRLCFNGCPDPYAALEILPKYPLIVEFGVIIDPEDSKDLENLMTNLLVTGSEVMAAQLSSLSFGYVVGAHIDYERFLTIVKSRWSSERCALKRAVLLSESDLDPEAATLTGLNALRDEGLDLLLLGGPDGDEAIRDWVFYARWI